MEDNIRAQKHNSLKNATKEYWLFRNHQLYLLHYYLEHIPLPGRDFDNWDNKQMVREKCLQIKMSLPPPQNSFEATCKDLAFLLHPLLVDPVDKTWFGECAGTIGLFASIVDDKYNLTEALIWAIEMGITFFPWCDALFNDNRWRLDEFKYMFDNNSYLECSVRNGTINFIKHENFNIVKISDLFTSQFIQQEANIDGLNIIKEFISNFLFCYTVTCTILEKNGEHVSDVIKTNINVILGALIEWERPFRQVREIIRSLFTSNLEDTPQASFKCENEVLLHIVKNAEKFEQVSNAFITHVYNDNRTLCLQNLRELENICGKLIMSEQVLF